MGSYNGLEILKSNWITKEHAAFHFDLPLDLLKSWIDTGDLLEWRRRSTDQRVVSVRELELLLVGERP